MCNSDMAGSSQWLYCAMACRTPSRLASLSLGDDWLLADDRSCLGRNLLFPHKSCSVTMVGLLSPALIDDPILSRMCKIRPQCLNQLFSALSFLIPPDISVTFASISLTTCVRAHCLDCMSSRPSPIPNVNVNVHVLVRLRRCFHASQCISPFDS